MTWVSWAICGAFGAGAVLGWIVGYHEAYKECTRKIDLALFHAGRKDQSGCKVPPT